MKANVVQSLHRPHAIFLDLGVVILETASTPDLSE